MNPRRQCDKDTMKVLLSLFISLSYFNAAFAGTDEFSRVRETAPHFWKWAKAHASEHFTRTELAEGLAVGDAHILNFGYTFIGDRYHFALEDIDDLGTAPLLLDFTRFVVSSEVLNSDISTYELLEAYQQGLQGKQPAPVKKIKEDFDGRPDWDTEKLEELETLEDSSSTAKSLYSAVEKDFKTALQVEKFDDVRVRIKESGGSKGNIRFWIAVQENGKTQVYEFKQLTTPATAAWARQASPKSRFTNATKIYRRSSKEFQIIETGKGSFYLRPRYDQPEPVEDLVEDYPKSKRLKNYSLFVAQAMGLMHGQQAAGRVIQRLLDKDFDAVFENIKSFRKAYVEELLD